MRWSDQFVEELMVKRDSLRRAAENIGSPAMREALRGLFPLVDMIIEERAFTKMIKTMANPPTGVAVFHKHIYDVPPSYEMLQNVTVSIEKHGSARITFQEDGASRPLEKDNERVVQVWADGDVQIIWPMYIWEPKVLVTPGTESASTPVVVAKKEVAQRARPGAVEEFEKVKNMFIEAGARLAKLERLFHDETLEATNFSEKKRPLENRREEHA